MNNDTGEVWRSVIGYEGYYEVSSEGRVKSLARPGVPGTKRGPRVERILRNRLTQKGYYSVILYIEGATKGFQVHRLVAEAFISNPDSKPQVNHKDLDKLNNAKLNLEWATNLENIKHAVFAGRYSASINPNRYSKLNAQKASEVREKLSSGVSQTSLAQEYGVSMRCIRSVKTKEAWN